MLPHFLSTNQVFSIKRVFQNQKMWKIPIKEIVGDYGRTDGIAQICPMQTAQKCPIYTLPTYTLPIKVVPTMYYHIKDRR